MVTTLTDAKRAAIGEKLADMRAIQKLIIENERMFASSINDSEIRNRIQDMLEDDEKNMGVLETTITQYGIQSEPSNTVKKMAQQLQEIMGGSELNMYQKLAQHELLKHGQVMSGLVVHKAGQIAGADVEAALGPLNTVNFENRAHQEQLKGVLEVMGTRELTGQEPDHSLWGRVQDAVAAMTGVVGSAVTQTSDKSDMNIQDVIRMDHQKAKTLVREILNCNNPQRIQEFFGQLYKDLIAHAKAEEEVVYPAIRSYYNKTQDLYDEQAEQERVLNDLKASDPASPAFKDKIRQLRDMTNHHISQEENEMFAVIRNNFSSAQSEQLATQFKEAKKQLQIKMGV